MGQFESSLDEIDFEDRKGVLEYDLTIRGVCNKIKSGKIKRIVILTGAGISSSAGIPDFRSPDTGIYNTIQEYNLPEPESLFDIDFFKDDPYPFYDFMKKLFLKNIYPTTSHYLMKVLESKGYLLRNYTQNIDALESLAGITPNKIVEAHGSLSTAFCIKCSEKYPIKFVLETVKSGDIPRCTNFECNGLIKPGIVFYGESLSSKFNALATNDMMAADLLIIMGTSLKVEPCASLVDMVNPLCVRMLWNREAVGPFVYKSRDNYRDVTCLGEIDEIAEEFAQEMNWGKELKLSKHMGNLQIDSEFYPEKFNTESTAYEKITIGLKRVASSISVFPCKEYNFA